MVSKTLYDRTFSNTSLSQMGERHRLLSPKADAEGSGANHPSFLHSKTPEQASWEPMTSLTSPWIRIDIHVSVNSKQDMGQKLYGGNMSIDQAYIIVLRTKITFKSLVASR